MNFIKIIIIFEGSTNLVVHMINMSKVFRDLYIKKIFILKRCEKDKEKNIGLKKVSWIYSKLYYGL